MEWVKAGPAGALPVSTVVNGKGQRPPFYDATLLFLVIEAVEFLAFIASYFYLRSTTNDWPPGDMALPNLLLPTLATVFLIASDIPTYLGDQAIKKKNDQRKLFLYLAVTILMELVFLALMAVHLDSLNFLWHDNAYASLYWVLIMTHLLFAGFMVLENLYALVEASKGFYNAERHWGITVDGLNSHFVTAAWIAIYLTVFISPYLTP